MSNSHCSLKISPLAIFLLMLAGCATTLTPTQPLFVENLNGNAVQYGQWTVGCSNMRMCIAMAPTRNNSEGEEQTYIEIGIADDVDAAQNIAIARDGHSIHSLSMVEANALLQELANGDGAHATFIGDAEIRYDVPRAGFADVMAAFEMWRDHPPQRRSETIPLTPLPAFRFDNPDIPQTLKGMAKHCPQGHMGESIQAWRLNGGATLWRAGCGNEGLNSVSFWAVSRPRNEGAEIVVFKDPDQPMESFSKWSKDDGAHQRMPQFGNRNYRIDPYNSWFDESTGYLRMVHYFGRWDSYQEDCGIYRAYAWNGDGMQLVERRLMPACGTGISPTGWIVTYRATVFNGPDSGP